MAAAPDPDLQARVDTLQWHHTIDLGGGVVTKGLSTEALGPERFPDFSGRTVLDIGAWDGGYSFLAERGGARRVVALDHYVWGIDWVARTVYWNECKARGELPDHHRDETDFFDPSLPGRRPFDLAKAALASRVEPVVADFMDTDLEALGVFDVTLYLGVLYHMAEPLTALRRLRAVTREVAVVETEAFCLAGAEHLNLLQFAAGDEFGGDFGNWYVPNEGALVSLCRAAGFTRVEPVVRPEPLPASAEGTGPGPLRAASYRALVWAWV